jgi:hypothetical protein
MKQKELSYEERHRIFETLSAPLRAELAQRTAAEVAFDDCVLEQLKRGKSFEVALTNANEKFPQRALFLSETELPDEEAHYFAILDLENMDENYARIEELNKRIAACDAQIAAKEEQIKRSLDQALQNDDPIQAASVKSASEAGDESSFPAGSD